MPDPKKRKNRARQALAIDREQYFPKGSDPRMGLIKLAGHALQEGASRMTGGLVPTAMPRIERDRAEAVRRMQQRQGTPADTGRMNRVAGGSHRTNLRGSQNPVTSSPSGSLPRETYPQQGRDRY